MSSSQSVSLCDATHPAVKKPGFTNDSSDGGLFNSGTPERVTTPENRMAPCFAVATKIKGFLFPIFRYVQIWFELIEKVACEFSIRITSKKCSYGWNIVLHDSHIGHTFLVYWICIVVLFHILYPISYILYLSIFYIRYFIFYILCSILYTCIYIHTYIHTYIHNIT